MGIYTFMGNLGRDAELQELDAGYSVVRFSVAEKLYGKDAGTQWVDVSLFGKKGTNLMPYLVKGKGVFVSGDAKLNSYTTKAGEAKTTLKVVANSVQFTGSGESEAKQAPTQKKSMAFDDSPADNNSFDDDEVPF